MHPAFLRTLEDWTTHQDYFWFLGVLAWGAVIAAVVRSREIGEGRGVTWLVVLAGFHGASALIELLLLAQDLTVPYTRFDFAMGVAQAGTTAALIWPATRDLPKCGAVRVAALVCLSTLAVTRLNQPLASGLGLCFLHALAVWGVVRRLPGALPNAAALLLVVGPLVATHGPWAYALNHGRRVTDWSHFALAAALTLLAPGVIIAVSRWRKRLARVIPEGTAGRALRRDLGWASIALIGWLAGGVMLSVWYGARARSAFEVSLLQRLEICARALNPDLVTEALRAELRIEKITTQRYRHGATIEVATIPETRHAVYGSLRSQTRTLRALLPDVRVFSTGFVRDGRLILFSPEERRPGNPYITHTIYPAEQADIAGLETGRSYFHGPVITPQFNTLFEARVPLRDKETGAALGWLIAGVDGTRWAATFTQARLQTMALVGVGVGLWTVGVLLRLRREARDAAERKAVAAAAADRMKSAFLAKVSHELRTPIQSVLGYGELLASAPLAEPHRTWLNALRTHGDVMLRLVNDLIDLGALQSGAFQLDAAAVKLPRLLDDCVAAVRPAADAKGLAFNIEVATDLPVWVRADGVRLRQVLLNLLTNAVKFTSSGRITLAARRTQSGALEFQISDTGPGIPVAQRARLFQPFARLDPSAAGGSGLGLALVKGICEAMGGSVELLDGEPGATFLVQCPLRPCGPPDEPGARSQETPATLSGLHILVAEDNTLVRELLVAFLSNAGAEVSVAHDGRSALKLAREFLPQVLLLDIGLPEMDGIAVAEALRRDGAGLQIIGLSAHANAADEARARAAGMDDFLTKPVSLGKLADVITASTRTSDSGAGSIIDAGLRLRLATQFARETPLVLQELHEALDGADWIRLRRAAHYLKNSADVLGLSSLQAACQQLYLVADSPEPGEAHRLLATVEAAIPAELLVSEDANSADFN